MSTFAEDRKKFQQSLVTADEERALDLFMQQHPELNCQANRAYLINYFNGDPIDASTLAEAVGYLGSKFARLDQPTIRERREDAAEFREKQRQQLIDQLADLLKHNGAIWVKQNRVAWNQWTNEKLQARVAEVQQAQRQDKMSVSEIRQEIKPAPVPRRADGFPTLPPEYCPPGKVQFVRIDANYLNQLPETNYLEYKRLVGAYGSNQINERRGIK